MQYFKYKLKLNKSQKTVVNQWIGSCRCLYNIALEQREMNDYKELRARSFSSPEILSGLDPKKNKSWKKYHGIDWATQDKELPVLKAEFPWFKEVPSQSLQQVLKQLENAYKHFFSGLGDYPKRKKKSMPFGMKFPQGFSFEEHKNPKKGYINLPKIGRLRYFKSRELEGAVRSVTLRKEGSDYFISVLCDVGDKYDSIINPSESSVGIDRGIAHTLVVSDGSMHELDLEKIKQIEDRIALEQQKLARKTRYSNNWFKTKNKIDRFYKKATYIRHDFAWKKAREIAKNHSVIALEDLKVKNMSRSASGTIENPGKMVAQKSGLNRSILRMGWYDFAKKLEWQAKKAGSRVIYCNPQHTSTTCNKCGHKNSDNRLDQARFHCEICEHQENADINAAKNILDKASGSGVYSLDVA